MSERKTTSQHHETIDLDHADVGPNFANLIAVLNLSLLRIPDERRTSAVWEHTGGEIDVYYERPETDQELAMRLEREEAVRQDKLARQADVAAKEIRNLRSLMAKHPEAARAALKEIEP